MVDFKIKTKKQDYRKKLIIVFLSVIILYQFCSFIDIMIIEINKKQLIEEEFTL